MLVSIIILIFILQHISPQIQLPITPNYTKTIQCIHKITNRFFNNYTILNIGPDLEDLGDEYLKSVTEFPLTLSIKRKYNEVNYHAPNYIIISNNATLVTRFLKRNRRHFDTKNMMGADRQVFVEFDDGKNNIELLRIAWKLLMSKFVVVQNGTVVFYKFIMSKLPNETCYPDYEAISTNAFRFPDCDFDSMVNRTTPAVLFPELNVDTIPTIRYVCPLKVFSSRYPPISEVTKTSKSGLQIEHIDFVSRYLKKEIFFAESFELGHFNSSERFDLDIGLATLGYLPYDSLADIRFIERFHLSTYMGVDKYVFVVPISYELIPLWLNMLFIFHWSLWLACGFTFLLAAIGAWLGLGNIPTAKLILNILRTNLGQAFGNFRIQNVPARIIFLVWILYGIVFTTSFQTRLVGILSTRFYDKQIISVDQIWKDPSIEVHVHSTYYDTIQNSAPHPERFRKIERELTIDVLKHQAQDLNFVSLVSYYAFCKYYNYTLHPKKHRPLLTYLRDTSYLYTVNLLVPKRHPLFGLIDQAILQIHQYGHFEKIYKDVTEGVIRDVGKFTPGQPRPLVIKQLLMPFVILALGLFLSFLTFLYEIDK